MEDCFPDLLLPVCMGGGQERGLHLLSGPELCCRWGFTPGMWEEAGMNMRNIPALSWKSFIRANLNCLDIANKPNTVKCWP